MEIVFFTGPVRNSIHSVFHQFCKTFCIVEWTRPPPHECLGARIQIKPLEELVVEKKSKRKCIINVLQLYFFNSASHRISQLLGINIIEKDDVHYYYIKSTRLVRTYICATRFADLPSYFRKFLLERKRTEWMNGAGDVSFIPLYLFTFEPLPHTTYNSHEPPRIKCLCPIYSNHTNAILGVCRRRGEINNRGRRTLLLLVRKGIAF